MIKAWELIEGKEYIVTNSSRRVKYKVCNGRIMCKLINEGGMWIHSVIKGDNLELFEFEELI